MSTPAAPVEPVVPPAAPPSEAILAARGLSKDFGGLRAVADVSLDIPRKSIVSIIGPNGAGKTTLFNMLTGLYKPTSGHIYFEGERLTSNRWLFFYRGRPD